VLEAFQKLKEQSFQPEPAENRWETTVVLDNGIRVQIGVTDRYVGQFYPLVDTTGADRIRTFAIDEIRMIRDLQFGRR
jgi:predicted methyltransferase